MSSVTPQDTVKNATTYASLVRPYSQSPKPVWGLASLFFTSLLVPPRPEIPPLLLRACFGAIFTGAGHVLSCGDARNGSGITTAWSLTYLLINLRKSLTPPRHPVSLALSGATLASAAIYGTEYFVLQKDEERQ
ncbi:uncharacterized protein LAESUDRAFT_714280 [Laetiporus sulphureus 93-53]|uniref:Uncharacterized protein n=1 Tax=Laetiporus sulphureus 93-53 TaxID=1314785 RepID=A0A165E9U9_9APHY|nr:uncharacterized protein LAESUDRAFT_714280 [Laetiporus sulphureus 93-53]KZT06553.1 hypothetical protein LAESUDRAFT_714280 [Laetiporus sulphureus 93-53]